MPRHYFLASSASRPIVLENREYKFVPLSILGGRISGVYDTDDETDVAILKRAVSRKVGIVEIDETEAEKAKKKIKTYPGRSALLSTGVLQRPRLANSKAGELLPMASIEDRAGIVASGAPPKPERPAPRAAEATIPGIISLARVGRVNPPQPFVQQGERMAKGKK